MSPSQDEQVCNPALTIQCMLTKEEIIKELQRYTKKNSGETPSEKKFLENTGIGIMGRRKYWSNYGELVLEAGLTPNKFDKTKYSSEQLCVIFIEVIREIGKWPTRGVLDLKHYNDSSFPESSTFYRKLGLTGDLAKNILKFVEDKEEYKDVFNICNSAFEKYENADELDEDSTKGVHGWVYLIKHGSRKEYRIGKTTNLLRRLGQNRIELPEKIIPTHSIETADITGVETYWLNRFQGKKMNGDWFNLSKSDVNEFRRWKRIV